jgi:hypothetical protein
MVRALLDELDRFAPPGAPLPPNARDLNSLAEQLVQETARLAAHLARGASVADEESAKRDHDAAA